MKTETENLQIRWDSKYNINTKTSAGINLYKDSYMLERLNRIYNESAKLKKYKAFMVPTTVCVRSQKTKDRFMSEDCKETLNKHPNRIPVICEKAPNSKFQTSINK